jgi:hypothetical protein
MVSQLFPDFIENPESYRASELMWERTVEDLAASMNQERQWKKWIPRNFADGSLIEQDGNPIYDARNDSLNRAVRIIQHPPVGDDVEIVGWVSDFDAEYDRFPKHELVLNLSLSEESLAVAREILRRWMSPDTTSESMKDLMKDLKDLRDRCQVTCSGE